MKKINITILLLLTLIILNCKNDAFAVTRVNVGNGSAAGAITGANARVDASCKFTQSQRTYLRIRMNIGGEQEKFGYLYTFSDSTGNSFFCIDPGKKGGKIYKKGGEVPNGEADPERYYYRIYKWYLDHKNESNAILYAQAAYWYVSLAIKENRTILHQEARDTIYSILMSQTCYLPGVGNKIKEAAQSPNFDCEKFNTKETAGSILNGNGFLLTYSAYLNLFETDKVGTVYGMSSSVLSDFFKNTIAEDLAFAILSKNNTYSGKLYYWYATTNSSGVQRLIGIAGCPPSDVAHECRDDLPALVNQYSTTDRVKMKNGQETEYYKKLKNLAEKYSAIPMDKVLNDESYISNPVCENDNITNDECAQLLDKLRSTASGTQKYTETLNKLKNLPEFDERTMSCDDCDTILRKLDKNDLATYDTIWQQLLRFSEFNRNPNNPSCNSYSCEPISENSECKIGEGKYGFYMSDSENDSCWKSGTGYISSDNGHVSSLISNNLSSRYCTVYCWEAFGSDLPGGIDDIKAGQAFFWGLGTKEDGYFGNVNASRKCTTTNINYTQFANDWNANEANILKAYNEYMARKNYNSQNAVSTNNTCYTSDTSACITSTDAPSCGSNLRMTADGKCINYNLDCPNNQRTLVHFVREPDEKVCVVSYSEPTQGATRCSSCQTGYQLIDGQCKKIGTEYKRNNVTYGTGTSSYTVNGATTCVANDVSDKVAEANRKLNVELNNFDNLLNNREKLKTAIDACQSNNVINETSIYTFNSKLLLSYDKDALDGIERNIDAEDSLIAKDIVSNFNSSGTGSGQLTVNCVNLQGSGYNVNQNIPCGNSVALQIQKYSSYTWNYAGYAKYYYNDANYFWRFVRETGLAVNSKTQISITPFYNGYYGFIAAFSLRTNFYFPATVTISGFGNNGEHFNALAAAEYENGVYKYTCPFHIENEIYGSECHYKCDYSTYTCEVTTDSPAYCKTGVKGLDLVYRVIQLDQDVKVSFPGLLGTGRKQGTNWADFITNNTDKFNKIMDFSKVYSKPIYSIDLTPTLIGEIRRDNIKYRNNKKDPYTSFTDENNQKKIICSTTDSSVNKTCASEYLSTLIKKGYLTGTYTEKSDTKERLAFIANKKNS